MSDRQSAPDRRAALAATMLRVVTAEITDSGRLVRARKLHSDGAVARLVVTDGMIVAEVQGSEPSPYAVRWNVAPLHTDVETARRSLPAEHPNRAVRLVPAAGDLRSTCTCPDAIGFHADAACKHAVAVLLHMADDVGADVEHLALWRGVTVDATGAVDPDDPAFDHDAADPAPPSSSKAEVEFDTDVGVSWRTRSRSADPPPAIVDPLGELLAFPGDRPPPAGRHHIAPLDAPVPRDDDLYSQVLADALDWMHNVSPW